VDDPVDAVQLQVSRSGDRGGAREGRLGWVGRRRQLLVDVDAAGRVDADEVGERAADVDPE
jgi:hypothetical protein